MKFSILTCSYNSLSGLKDAVRQCRSEVTLEKSEEYCGTGFEVEHIIIDGGSTDGTAAWLRQESERRIPTTAGVSGNIELSTSNEDPHSSIPQFPNFPINYSLKWISEPDQGLYDALNKGLRMATGDVIGILHTDDVWEAGALGFVVQAFGCEASLECGSLLPPSGESGLPDGGRDTSLESMPTRSKLLRPQGGSKLQHSRPSVDGIYSDLVYVDAEDISKVRRYWKSGTYDPKKFYNGWMPPHTSLFVTREFMQRVGDYRLDLGSAADYEWMLRACLVHDAHLAYIPEVLVRMRVGGASNASVKGRLKAHGSDQKAWELNGLKPKPWTLKMKVIRKIPQWVRRFAPMADG
jgi:glycosyltransferase